MIRQVARRRQANRQEPLVEDPRKPARDTRTRNRVFLMTVVAAIVVGFWLTR